MKTNQNQQPPIIKMSSDIDEPCRELCRAINKIEGIRTVESCCGHSKDAFHVWFITNNFDLLAHLNYWFDCCHCGFSDWRILVWTDCGKQLSFLIEGPVGWRAYYQANQIADLLDSDNNKGGENETT